MGFRHRGIAARTRDMNAAQPGTVEVCSLRSHVVDDEFRIAVAQCGENPSSTLLVTDADGLFGLAIDTVRLMQLPGLVPDMYVVGIGYPGARSIADTVHIRARDLTPTRSRTHEHSGGGDHFANFLTAELHPWLRGRLARAAGDLTYFGHSLGGMFGTYLILTRPEMFSRYIISSPSLWWDDRVIFDVERTRAEGATDLPITVFFGIGSLETDAGRREESRNLPEHHPGKPPSAHLDMVDDLRRFIDQLTSRNYPSLALRAVEIPDEYHATVPGIVLNRALRHFHATGRPAVRAPASGSIS